jgi:hypothetical protein
MGGLSSVARVGGGALPPNTITLPTTTAAAQAAWFVDPVSGSDSNDGATPGTALATLTQWAERVGQQAIHVAMVVTILSDLSAGDEPMGPINVASDGGLRIVGTPTKVATGLVVSAVTPADPANNIAWVIQTAAPPGGVSWATHITAGRRILITSGPNAGAVAWPVKDVGSNAARCSWPLTVDPNLGAFGQSQKAIVAAATFDIETTTSLGAFALRVELSGFATFQVVGCNVGGGVFDGSEGNTELYGCQLESGQSYRGGAYVGCCSTGILIMVQGAALFIFGGAVVGPGLQIQTAGIVEIDFDFMCQGGNVEFFGPGDITIGSLAIFDWTVHGGVQVWQGVTVQIAGIFASKRVWGSVAANLQAFRINTGAFVLFDTDTSGITLNSIAATSDVSIGSHGVTLRYAALPYQIGTVQTRVVTANENNATTILQNSAFLSVPLVPNHRYHFEIVLSLLAENAGSTKVQVNGPPGFVGASQMVAIGGGNLTTTAPAFAGIVGVGGPVSAVAGSSGGQVWWTISGTIHVGATAGNLVVAFAEATHSFGVQLNADGSSMVVTELTTLPDSGGMMLL